MKLAPLTTQAPGLEGLYTRTVKLSARLQYGREYESVEYADTQNALTLARFVCKENGDPAKTVEEWDDWLGDNIKLMGPLLQEVMESLGSLDGAKKN